MTLSGGFRFLVQVGGVTAALGCLLFSACSTTPSPRGPTPRGGPIGEAELPTDRTSVIPGFDGEVEIALTPPIEVDYTEYTEEIRDALETIDTYWADVFPALYGTSYMGPRGFYAYHPNRGDYGPACPGNPPPGAQNAGNAFYCPGGDFLMWDEPGLMFAKYEETGDMAIWIILAHEWGHAIQARSGGVNPGKGKELQADCYAGAFITSVKHRMEVGDEDEAMRTFYELRDAPGTQWFDPAAHGNAQERISAYLAGIGNGAGYCAGGR